MAVESAAGERSAMSLRQYAKHRGVALSAVQKAISSGRITTLADGRIDPVAADAAWAQNTNTYAPAVTREEDEPGFGASQYTKARAVREHYQARLAKIDYEERIAKVIPADEVKIAAFNLTRLIRDRLMNIPDRVVGAVLAEVRVAATAAGVSAESIAVLDMSKVHGILATEVRGVLDETADATER